MRASRWRSPSASLVLLLAAAMLTRLAAAKYPRPAPFGQPCQYCLHCRFCDSCAACTPEAAKAGALPPHCANCRFCGLCGVLCEQVCKGHVAAALSGFASRAQSILSTSVSNAVRGLEASADTIRAGTAAAWPHVLRAAGAASDALAGLRTASGEKPAKLSTEERLAQAEAKLRALEARLRASANGGAPESAADGEPAGLAASQARCSAGSLEFGARDDEAPTSDEKIADPSDLSAIADVSATGPGEAAAASPAAEEASQPPPPAGADGVTGDGVTGGAWRAHVDKASGNVYYHNAETQETQWERPEGFPG
jgi:hypothetical protein